MTRKSRLLIVEDEAAIRSGLVDVFVYHGYEVEAAEHGEVGLKMALGGTFDLILLDVMLPGIDGFEICNQIRQQDRQQPVIMLTAKSSDEDIVQGLTLGADDYVAKPFSVTQLVLRVQAVLRRSGIGEAGGRENRLINGIVVDSENLCAEVKDEKIVFTRREMDLLQYLKQQAGRPVGREELRNSSQKYRKPLSSMASMSRIAYSFQQGARSGQKKGAANLSRYLTLVAWTFPAALAKAVRLTGVVPASQWLTPDVEGAEAYPVFGQGISTFSRRLLERASRDNVRRRRRANHERWVNLVGDIDGVGIVHSDLPEGACPLYFLVQVADPAGCVERLALLDIEAFNWWQHLSPRINWRDFPIARQFKQTLLALPLHQPCKLVRILVRVIQKQQFQPQIVMIQMLL